MTIILKHFSQLAMDSTAVRSKFRGCLLGSLMGDCLGAPYEGDVVSSGDRIVIQRYFDKLQDPSHKGLFRKYTDDTAMTKSVAHLLIDRPEPDYKYLAKLFVDEYYDKPKRGYGQNVVNVFEKLKKTKYDDVFKPASEQFGGTGSYGNGGAMRIAPLAIFYHDNYDLMLDVATKATKITHSNKIGINGALLQCLAIHQAFLIPSNQKIDVKDFCEKLVQKIKQIETPNAADQEEDNVDDAQKAYQNKLKIMENILGWKYSDELDDEVITILGNGISAYESVPTAIYCFLRAQNDIPKVQTDNLFRRTIQYAITLGGDTDTIASMAGAIAGAHLGEEGLNMELLKHCEYHSQMREIADKLYEASKT